jgi:hypothetical protein
MVAKFYIQNAASALNNTVEPLAVINQVCDSFCWTADGYSAGQGILGFMPTECS